jgi:hypothetical protein
MQWATYQQNRHYCYDSERSCPFLALCEECFMNSAKGRYLHFQHPVTTPRSMKLGIREISQSHPLLVDIKHQSPTAIYMHNSQSLTATYMYNSQGTARTVLSNQSATKRYTASLRASRRVPIIRAWGLAMCVSAMHLLVALQGQASNVLHGVPKEATYMEIIKAHQDHFRDQHLATVYQSAGDKDPKHWWVPAKVCHHHQTVDPLFLSRITEPLRKGPSTAFSNGIRDQGIKQQLLLGSDTTVNETLWLTLELEVVRLFHWALENKWWAIVEEPAPLKRTKSLPTV